MSAHDLSPRSSVCSVLSRLAPFVAQRAGSMHRSCDPHDVDRSSGVVEKVTASPGRAGRSKMAEKPSFGRDWEEYRTSKGIWFWSSSACVVVTIVVGFAWGGWITGGTGAIIPADAAYMARAQLAAADCVVRFDQGPDAASQLAALKQTDSYERSDLLKKDGGQRCPAAKNRSAALRVSAFSG
jgi:hypothetical protein